MKGKWIIEDWTGKRLHPDKEFDSFEDGWSFIQEGTDEEDWDDIYVVAIVPEESEVGEEEDDEVDI